MKKLFVIFFCFLTAVSLFAGGQGAGGTGASGASGKTSRTGAKGSLPLATNKPVLTMYIAGGINEVTTSFDYKDNLFTKKVVDETGIDLRVTGTPSADARERLNVLMNTGDYPDIISGDLDIEYYAKQGSIIALDPYDPLSFPNIKRIFTETPEAPVLLTASDGKMYALPAINQCLHCTYSAGRIWFYMPWVRDTGRKTPQTLDEFTDFLRFAKNNDPNKNGKKDEMGIVFNKDDILNFIAKIAKAYMPFVQNRYYGLTLDNSKKIVEQYRDPAFREALKYIAGLYKEGLIERDSFSMTSEQEMGIVRSEEPIAAAVGTSWINGQALPGTQRFLEYFYVPALKGPTGQQWATNQDVYGDIWPIFYVTDKCKDPELAIAFYDYFNNPDMREWPGGPKGVTWDDADPGAVGYDGQPAKTKALMEFGTQPINSAWHNNYIRTTSQAMRNSLQVPGVLEMQRFMNTMDKSLEPQILANTAYLEYMFYYTSMDATKHALPASGFVPPLVMSDVDNARVADINAVLDPFQKQAFVEFITGVRDINNNSHWNAYLTELDRLGSPEMVSIRQKYIK
jgi:putative aldouronate transport system substrate-binding protein